MQLTLLFFLLLSFSESKTRYFMKTLFHEKQRIHLKYQVLFSRLLSAAVVIDARRVKCKTKYSLRAISARGRTFEASVIPCKKSLIFFFIFFPSSVQATAVQRINWDTPKKHIFPFGANGKIMVLCIPILSTPGC